MDRVCPEPNTRCWLWTGATYLRGGYGKTRHLGKEIKAHRLAWILFRGPIPITEGPHGTCVLHNCDTPACVNPDHLRLGDQRENLQEMHTKGRSVFQTRPELRRRGAKHGMAKLTQEQVDQIRALGASGMSQRKIAALFGVTKYPIHRILNGTGWR